MKGEEIKGLLRREMQRRMEANLVPDAGQWVPRAALENKLREERRAARTRALELLMLYVGSTAISLWLIALYWYLCY